jgi:formate hydrogenlyase subunit 3/multisubunit Na+/H+ antiporter MnhD subunit
MYAICLYLLFAMNLDSQKRTDVLDYILFGGVASVFIVLAIEILYIMNHTLNISTIVKIGDGGNVVLYNIAMLFVIMAVFIKVGIFPFNGWVAKVYGFCPNFLLPLYGSLTMTFGVYLLIFFQYYVIKTYDSILFASNVVTPFCIGTMVMFSLLAIKEKDMKMIFAYSTLVQASYAIICISTPNVSAVSGGILHIVHNVICKFGMFAIISQIYNSKKSYNVSVINGLFASNKIVATCFCIFIFSMIGFPFTSGFITKFYMFQGLIEEKRFYVLAFFVIGTILSLIYLWKIIQLIFFGTLNGNFIKFNNIQTLIISSTALISILFGIFPKFTLEKSQTLVIMFLQNLS